ncbi:MAG: hypothetical protein NVS3B25_34300 [Hymenobacter sp.]
MAYLPLTAQQVADHLKTDPSNTSEAALLNDYLTAAVAVFQQQSRRKFLDPSTPAPVPPAVLDPVYLVNDEVEVGKAWLRFYLGHMYENRQSVAVSLHTLEVPDTCQLLMRLIRVPAL